MHVINAHDLFFVSLRESPSDLDLTVQIIPTDSTRVRGTGRRRRITILHNISGVYGRFLHLTTEDLQHTCNFDRNQQGRNADAALHHYPITRERGRDLQGEIDETDGGERD